MAVALCQAWVGADRVRACEPCEAPDLPAGYDLTTAISVASEVLYVLSGRQWPGSCAKTVRPCHMPGCGSYCSCWAPTVLLDDHVTAITQVRVDGAIVPAGEYRLDQEQYLVRLADADGVNPGWPHCQRLDLAPTEEGTFEVVYAWGHAPPDSGVEAAASLACQIALACEGSSECRLPKRVQTITRQGVTIGFLDPFSFLDKGRTGIYEVDLFLGAVNPHGLDEPAHVLSPDYPPHRVIG